LATVGPKTINNELLVLAGILKSARLWGPLRETYEPLPIPKRGPGKALTIEQTAKLIEAAKSNDKWFVALCASLLAYSTGCRSGEIKTLKLGDLVIDVDRPYLRIRAENSKGRRDREPALNDLALWAVKRLLFRAELLGARSPEHYLLPADMSKHTKSADPLRGYASFDPTRHQTSWQTAWEKLKKAAGIESFRFHDLRHTHITHAIEAGVPIEVVMAQVGHISADMTRYYTHVASGAKHAAVQAIQAKGSAIVDVLNAEAPGSG
jgi:integrase